MKVDRGNHRLDPVGLLQAGDRLPSVRQTSASRGVSPSTVFKAYYLLERAA